MDRVFNTIVACIGACIGYLFGKMDGILIALITFMVFDYITGIMKSAKAGALSSSKGRHGILKKISILVCVIVANIIDTQVIGHLVGGVSPCKSAVVLVFLSNEALSILENAAAMGVPIPSRLMDIIESVRNGINGEEP